MVKRIDLNFCEAFSAYAKDHHLLDLGCGVGYLEHYLLKKGFRKITAIDISEEQIDIARKILKDNFGDYSNHVGFEIADAFEYLRRDLQFHGILMIDFLEHFVKEQVIDLLSLVHEKLHDDGRLILRVSNGGNPFFSYFFFRDFTHETPFTIDSIRQVLSLTGFELIRAQYEKLPLVNYSRLTDRVYNRLVKSIGLKLLGIALGFDSEAFSEAIITVAKKK